MAAKARVRGRAVTIHPCYQALCAASEARRAASETPGDKKDFLCSEDRSGQMSFALIAAEKAHHSVSQIARVLGVSRAGYYGSGESTRGEPTYLFCTRGC